jgi:hypothetical protein
MKSSTITAPVLSIARMFLLPLTVVSLDCPHARLRPVPCPERREERHTGPSHQAGRIPSCQRSLGDSNSQLHKARTRLRELLHEVQRDKTRDERMTALKMCFRSGEALLL